MRFMVLAIAMLAAASGAQAHDREARYLGNEGVMVTRGETKILFDAFYGESFGGQYTLVPNNMEAALLAGRAPFDGVDAIFISHIHPDHFNSRKTIAYLRAHPGVKLYAGMDVIGAMYAADVSVNDPLAKQLVAVHVARGAKPRTFTLAGVDVEAFAIPHNGNGPIPHFAFRVTLDNAVTVMHLGDSDAAESHFTPYQAEFDARPTDAAFAPVWMLTSEGGKRVLQQVIRPRQAIAIHAEDQQRKSADTVRKELGADVFLEPGESRSIGAQPR